MWILTRSDTKPGCTATGDGLRLEVLDLGRRGTVLSISEDDLRFLFLHMQNVGFLTMQLK